MDNQAYDLPDGHDPLDIAAYMSPEAQRFIISLGLIADATNENDATARSLVGVAIGLWGYEQIEAAFLGDRISALSRRMQALADVEGRADPDRDAACEWLKRAARLSEKRDGLLHRPTWIGVVDDRVAQLLRRSRRDHQVEPLGDKAEQLVQELFASVKEGKRVLLTYVLAKGDHQRATMSAGS